MKRPVRPVFSFLFLLVFAVFLTFRVLRRVGFVRIDSEIDVVVYPLVPPLSAPAPVFNSSLLEYAAIDVGEARSRQEVEQLLESSYDSKGRYRAFTSWRRSGHRDIRAAATSKSTPVTLRSPKFYRDWLNFRRVLHDWARNKQYQPTILNELAGLVKDPLDRYHGSAGSKSRYGSCAVVGNSGILLEKKHGKLIDAQEVVIRLNNARTERFVQSVGSKTNISFVNSNILHLCARRKDCFCHPYGADVPIIAYICQPVHFVDYTICNSSHKSPLIVTDPRFDVLCARIVKYYSIKRFTEETGKSVEEWSSEHDGAMFHYSSGFQAVMLAVGICDRVSIFGFGKSSAAKHHYHTNQKAELALHHYEAEYDFYNDLVTNPQTIPFISNTFRFPSAVIYQ